jgi:hypothetical protein
LWLRKTTTCTGRRPDQCTRETCTEVLALAARLGAAVCLGAGPPPVAFAAIAVACADTELPNRIPLRDAAEAPCRYRLQRGGGGGLSRRRRDGRTRLQPT